MQEEIQVVKRREEGRALRGEDPVVARDLVITEAVS